MRVQLGLTISVTACLLAAPARGDDKRDCAEHKNLDLRIAACSKIIQQAPTDAAAYNNRGDARGRKGDVDNAIADYSKAIEINPAFGRAYDSRGRAYASKGDYTRAVVDVTKASELAPKQALAPKKTPAKAAEQAPPKPAARPAKAPAKAASESTWPAWAALTVD